MPIARLPGAALDTTLENLLKQHPNDCVTAVGPSEYLLRRLTEALPLGIFQVDEQMTPVYANAGLSAVIGGGITSVFDALLIAGANGHSHGRIGDPATVREALAQVLVHGGDRDAEILLRPAKADERHCVISLRGLVDEQGTVTGAIACIDDITARRQMEAELASAREAAAHQRGEARFRSLVQHASDLITVVTPQGAIVYQSPSISSLFGYVQDEARAADLLALAHHADRQRLKTILSEAACHPGTSTRFEWTLRHANESWRQVQTTLTNLLDDVNVQGLVMNTRDVTEQKALEEQLSHQAFHDSLTGLANRALFNNRVEHALRMRDSGGRCTVMMLDLDDFKRVNDSLGHLAGDELLVQVAQSIASGLRPFDTAARFGGDEFAILLAGIDQSDGAVEIADRLLGALSTPLVVQGQPFMVRASIGIAHSADGIGPQDLLRSADTALYAAKAQGKNRCQVYSDEMARAAMERLETENDLRQAIGDGELRVFYQPIVSLPDEGVCEVEALVRWRHPRRGLLTPFHFIAIAEESGLIVRLGQHVLQTACRDVRVWQRDHPGLIVSVNLSARQFQHPGLIEDVEDVLRKTGIAPCTLKLEVTESLAMADAVETIRILGQLKQLGVLLAIDDFGTGYSSLAYLKDFTVDTLKIDQSFVRELANDARNDVIVESMVTLARNLGLSVTAEGIERAEDGARLAVLGCHRGQGYLYARPLGATELTAYLAEAAGRVQVAC